MICFAPSIKAEENDRATGATEDLKTVLFGSLDGGNSTFGSVGLKRMLTGPLDRSGPVGMASFGYGRTIEQAWWEPETHVIRHTVNASAVIGYQWVRDGIVMAAFAGPEVQSEQLSRDAMPSLGEPHLGVRLHGELWAHPTQDTLLTATVIGGTAATPHLWARASAGYAFWNGIFVGPEASVYATETYRELRLGAHITGFAFGGVNLRLSAGWRGEEETGQQGAYVGLSGHIRM